MKNFILREGRRRPQGRGRATYTYGELNGKGNSGESDIFVAKYDTRGTKQWTRLLGTSSHDTCSGIAVDSNGNSYITGYTRGDLDGNTNAAVEDIFVWKLVDLEM